MFSVHDYHLLNNALVVGAVLFSLGTIGFVVRRNLIVMILSAGIMLQGAVLTLCAFGTFHGNGAGRVVSLFVLAATALHGAVALPMIFLFAGRSSSLDLSMERQPCDPQRLFEQEQRESPVDKTLRPEPSPPVADPERPFGNSGGCSSGERNSHD